MMDRAMFLYDTHVHTKDVSRCGASTAAEQVRKSKKMGYTGIIITDHLVKGYSRCDETLPWEQQVRFLLSGYEAAKAEGRYSGLDVFFGWEYASWSNIPGMDILTYGLDEKFLIAHPKLFTFNLEKYSRQIHKHGGYLAQAHPFRNVAKEDRKRKKFPAHLLDGAEVFNGCDTPEINALGYDYALRNNLCMQAGSDSHGVGRPDFACGVALEKKADSIFDIINAIKLGTAKLVTGDDE
ncbi:MAG: PHP domain-containing protein [Firmicutes bacterium]|nr:PHP domain-containing protein [Bacillota bacterium]